MKKIFSFLLLCATIVFASCSKEDVTPIFNGEGINLIGTIEVTKGVYQISPIPYMDGSTNHITFKISSIKNTETGEDVTSQFNTEDDTYTWKEPYNGITDITMELANQKLQKTPQSPVQIIPCTGQLIFNTNTAKLKEGTYSIDIEADNNGAIKRFEQFGTIKLKSAAVESLDGFGDLFMGVSLNGELNNIKNFDPYTPEAMVKIGNNTHPNRKITKTSDSDVVELELVVKDAEGTIFPPQAIKEVVYDDSANKNYNSYHVNSIATNGNTERVSYTKTACVFHFPTVPYPAFNPIHDSGNEMYQICYSINNSYWKLTSEYQQIANTSGVIYPSYQVWFKNSYKINEPGKWLIEITCPYVICIKQN